MRTAPEGEDTMARRDKVDVHDDVCQHRDAPKQVSAARRAGRYASPANASHAERETPTAALTPTEPAGVDAPDQVETWEGLLLARWGRLHLLLAVIQPLLPPEHPRLRLIRRALFSTYQDLRALGVNAHRIPTA